ncbi:UDP-N-acetylmuramoyl-tripeptide--D-alanyl-D-alanine ligase [Prochlorococcus sp. MIT 1341]|uniref:UDP-N-acetylmuramoyl-tripeptide--D-alanyl-D- alanine ligase n=1 Tax=Prochlorococcus sp. MIT 1341 TaxID=3096221 RepID=UPI002A75B91C|nr:UDP-N-acetylmuramoyl-tripeptide--D-alanyl-D-alanine ligase [Prochlorococcus sp. MIT 1341]
MVLILSDLIDLWGEPHFRGCRKMHQPLGTVSTDTRLLSQGDFFIPLIGEKFNGHEFLLEASDKRAQAALVSFDHASLVPDGFLHWIVEDTLIAYQQLACLHRSKFKIPFVAVTGSAGKTTTREMIVSALRTSGLVLSSRGNENNDIGVAYSLMQVHSGHKAAVIEMGMRGLGEIKRLSKCTQPDIAVITNVGNAHIGRLGSRANIAIAKCEITSSLNPKGVLIIPAGDQLLESTLSKSWHGRTVRVALAEGIAEKKKGLDYFELPQPDLVGHPDFIKQIMEVEGDLFDLPLRGRHNALNFMLALAVAKECGIDRTLLQKLYVKLPVGRSREIQIGGITVLDQTYNASPEAVLAALDLLAEYSGRHFAVLGSMLELGEQSHALHAQVAKKTVDLSLDGLIVLADGVEADAMTEVASCLNRFVVVKDISEAYHYLCVWLKSGDNLLVKGSRKVGLEELLIRLEKFNS